MSKYKDIKALLIDDEPSISQYFSQILSSEGFIVAIANNGKEGLKLFKSDPPDIIIVDLRMPELDGFEVISTVSEKSPNLPIIVASGTADIRDAVSAIKRGAWDYILKPVHSKQALLHAVEKALERAQLKKENENYQEHLEKLVKKRTAELEKTLKYLAQSEMRFRSVVEDQTETIMRYLPDMTITFVNDSFCRYYGKSCENLIGRNFLQFIYKDDREGVESKVKSLNTRNPMAVDERRVNLPNGKTGWQQWTDRLIQNKESKVVEYQAVGIDIMDRKLGEEALKDALAEVQKLKDQLQDENIYLREEIKLDHNFEEIYGNSEGIKEVLKNVEMVAPNDTTVIILGESGTGKELVARAIHNLSSRKNRPLVKVNCAALPANLIESELLGHEKGSFTGATAQRKGRFELANGGTIFLDEIGDLPLDVQTKLLRVLQEGEFERVGGEETISVDVRVIAATNRHLQKAIAEGDFREDLYYRLNVIPINVPPLRERPEDIPILAMYFANRYGRKMGKDFKKISKKTMDMLISQEWRGNIRELENVIERAVIFSKEPVLHIDYPTFIPKQQSVPTSKKLQTLEELEREHISNVLKHTHGTIEGANGAAMILDMHPNTLRSRMKKLNINKSSYSA